MSRTILPIVLLILFPLSLSAQNGFQGWKFGMTKEEVQNVKDCSPYKPVEVTGGLECANFQFMGGTIPISFIFKPNLAKIQVWVYEGKDKKEAAKRLVELMKYLKDKYGDLESPHIEAPLLMKAADWEGAIDDLVQLPPENSKWQFKPVSNPKEAFVFCSFISHPQQGFYLFLYFQPPK